jgi:oligopeptidase B
MTHDIPQAEQRAHTRTRPNGDVEDPYSWMANPKDPAIIGYLTAENSYADAWFGRLEPTIQNIFEEIKGRINEDDSSYPVRHADSWYVSRTETGKSYAIHSRGNRPEQASEHVLIDENIEAAGADYFSLSAFDVSPHGQFLAWSSDTDGSEKFTLRVRDLSVGTDLPDVITGTTWGGTAWSRDNQWLFYVLPDEAMRPSQVWRHRLGTPSTEDILVLNEPDERFFLGVGNSRSTEWIIIEASSKTSSEAWLINATSPTSEPQSVTPRRDDVEYSVDHWGEHFAIITNKAALDFQVCLAPVSAPSEWVPFVSHISGQRIAQFECFDGHAVMQRWVNAQQVISVVSPSGDITDIAILDEPHDAEIDANPDYSTTGVRLSYQSLTTPATTAWYSLTNNTLTTLKQVEVPNSQLDNYVSERLWADSADGVRIPLDIVRHKDTPLNGTAPGLVYAYGSYEASMSPWFSAGRLSLLDRGFVWALAHPRGGGEMGRQWYLDGKFLNKRNTFTDTLACASHLAESKICDGNKLVVRGGSAGGLLVGACVTMNPQRFAGAVAEVPFVDVVNTMSDPSMPLTVTEWEEWGDPRSEPYASYIASYSPYDNTTSVKYPNMYVTAGLNDPRVSYHEPAKWVAKLRQVSPETTVVFRCEMGAGHGGPSGRYEQWRDEARTLSFIVDCVS